MRDKRAITIRDSRLQKIRNNFRDLFLKAISVEWNRLFDEMDKLRYMSDGTRRTIDDFSPSELKQYRSYQDQQSELRMLADKSICKCVACRKPDRDMVYNKAYDAWYCTECYGSHRAHAKKLDKKKKEAHGHEEKAVDELYKTFL